MSVEDGPAIPSHIFAAACFAFASEKIRAVSEGEHFREELGIARALQAAFQLCGFRGQYEKEH